VLTLAACRDTMLYRASQDYFPLIPGSEWHYCSGNDTIYLSVDTTQALIQNQPCTVLWRNFAPEYWTKGPTEIRKFFVRTASSGDTLEARLGLVYQLPLVLGASWREVFRDTIVIRGTDTVYYTHSLTGTVTAIAVDSTPAGVFDDCYKVEFTDQVIAGDTITEQFGEWLAPGTGVVHRQTGTGEERLLNYRSGP